jgi:hypothetical protein
MKKETTTELPLLVTKIDWIADQVKQLWQMAKNDLAALMGLYKATGLPGLSSDELPHLFADTEALLYDKITGGGHTHVSMEDGGKMKVEKAAALAILQKPVGYAALLAGIKAYIGNGSKYYKIGARAAGFPVNEVVLNLQLDAAGNVQFTERVEEIIEAAGNCEVKTPKGLDIANFCQGIADAYFANNMDEHVRLNGNTISVDYLFEKIRECMGAIDYDTKTAILTFRNEGRDFVGDNTGLL